MKIFEVTCFIFMCQPPDPKPSLIKLFCFYLQNCNWIIFTFFRFDSMEKFMFFAFLKTNFLVYVTEDLFLEVLKRK